VWVVFGFLDKGNSYEFPALKIESIFSDPKLKQINLMKPHPKGYGFSLWT